MRVIYLGKKMNFTYNQHYDITEIVDNYARIRDDFSEEYLYKLDSSLWRFEKNTDISEYFNSNGEYNIIKQQANAEVAASIECRNIYVKKDIEVHKKSKYDFNLESDVKIDDIDVIIEKGSTITSVRIIASGRKIREVKRLVDRYRINESIDTNLKDWKKMTGNTIITDEYGYKMTAEVHWYQCKHIGRVEFKVKQIY